jgi:hypothetical protein
MNSNRLRVSKGLSDGDDLFSYCDDTEDVYLHRKQLMQLENDKSVTIDESIYDEEEYRTKTQVDKKKIRNHEELLKFISDTSDIIYDNRLVIDKTNLFLPSCNRRDSEKYFTLQSSGNSVSHHREKIDLLEIKLREANANCEQLINANKQWQLFYIKMFNMLNFPIPVSEEYGSIFEEEMRCKILDSVDQIIYSYEKIKNKCEEKLKLSLARGANFYILNTQNRKYFDPDCMRVTKSNFKLTREFDRYEDSFKFEKEKNIMDIEHAESFNITNLNTVKINPNIFILEKANNFNILQYPNLTTDFEINYKNYASPLKIEDKNAIKVGISSTKKKLQFNVLIVKCEINIQIYSSPKILKFPNKVLFYSKEKNIIITSLPKLKSSTESQTLTSQIDMDRQASLNQEYQNQLILYQNEKEEIENDHRIHTESLKAEIKSLNKQMILNNRETGDMLYPETIPPEQTFKIFLHFVRHLKYEDEMYKTYVESNDLKSIKSFVEKVENHHSSQRVSYEDRKSSKSTEKKVKYF